MEKSNNQEQIDKKYLIIEKVGTGGQANVFLVKDRHTEIKYVAKVLKEEDNTLENEIKILQNLKKYNNPYIINIIDSGEGEIIRNFRKTKNTKYCILENAPNGTIFDYLYCKHIGFGELYGKFIFQKILLGIQLCHQNNICHRDIKLENILLDENFNPKICDFGYACYNEPNLSVNLGTSGYKPPEISRLKPYDGSKVDIFCLGASLIRLVAGISGFDKAIRQDQKYHMIMNKKYKEFWEVVKSQHQELNLSSEFKDLYIKMVIYNPQSRLTADEVLNHPWFDEINKMSDETKEELEKKIKEEFIKLIPEVKANCEKEIIAADKISESDLYNVRSFRDEDENYFNPELRIKYMNTPIKTDNCIKIKGFINPNKLMNELVNRIKEEFDIMNCLIQTSVDKPKFNLAFENDEYYEEAENEDKEEDIEDENDDDEDNEEILMQFRLYETVDGHLLKFILKKGNRKDFLDKFEIISKLVEQILI
jgi:serine/threonine protein kinase